MKKKIFITGISSEIILSFIDLLDLTAYEIYGLTRNPENVNTSPKIKLIKGDIKHVETFKPFLKECSIFIHAAAITHSFNEKEYFDINLEATKELIDLANQCGIKKFIFISSNTAGEHSGAYGKTKFLAEKYIEKKFKNWLILRPAEVYGGDKNEGIEKFISGVIKHPIALYPVGVPTKLYPVHVDDVAEILYKVIFAEEISNEKITICGPKGYSFPELLHLIKSTKEKPIFSIPISKNFMFLIEKLTRRFPFYIGILPDQILRLYSRKNFESTLYRKGKKSFKTYLVKRLLSKA